MNRYLLQHLVAFCLLLLFSSQVYGQIRVQLAICNQDYKPLSRVECLVTHNDSVIAFSTISEEQAEITVPCKGTYSLSLSGYNCSTWEKEVTISTDTLMNVVLEERSIVLKEVVVKGKSPVSATGETFTLSEKARKENDPFKALSEIPVLITDPITQSITTRDGSTPLVLIDGRMVNSGISPILPADIKSVTIEDVVSARYLDQGITKIINIHLRKNRPLYLYAEGRTRHDVPLRNGFAGSNFEIGRSRFAVYGSIFYNYLTNDKTDFENIEKHRGLEKNMSGSSVARKNSLNLDLLMKWVPSENDYFAWKVSNRLSGARKNNSMNGEYVTNSVASQMSSTTHTKDDQNGWFGSFYYERTFSDKSNLDVFAYFNHAKACKDERYSEYTDTEQLSSIVALDNIRNQAAFDVDYIGSAHRYGQIEAGNYLLYTHDNVWDRALESSALSHVSQTSNYSFLSYSNNWRRFMLMTSVGLQGMFVKADSRSDNYWRPKASTAMAFRLSRSQTARISYTLSNKLPTAIQLAPVSSSVNPWQKVEGNINLRPVQTHDFALTYDINIIRSLRLQTFVRHNITTNMIEGYLRNEEEYVVQSYRNNGNYNRWNAGTGLSIRTGSVMAYLSPDMTCEHYNTGNRLFSWGMNCNLTWWAKDRLAVIANAGWKNRSYSAISTTEYANPLKADVSIAWYPTEQIQISAGVNYIGGVRKQSTTIDMPDYYQHQRVSFRSESFRPWILFAYTIRKHSKLQIDNRMPSPEF